jgi:SagB-type dehydrogenase family enzyme
METANWLKYREAEDGEDRLWELFHENSKVTRFDHGTSNDVVVRLMAEQYDHLAFDGCARIALAPASELALPLGAAIRRRRTPLTLAGCTIPLNDLSTLLFHAAGITRPETDGLFPRPFRAAPSGGAMYPLDLFIHATQVEGLPSGLYHYNPYRHDLATLAGGDRSRQLADVLVQSDLAYNAAFVAFIVATFERSTQKYHERGYRFALIEAGHVCQNLLLGAVAQGLAGMPLGGYYDSALDGFLELDGVTHAAVYAVAVGASPAEQVLDDPAR